jgi:hypothetical protein
MYEYQDILRQNSINFLTFSKWYEIEYISCFLVTTICILSVKSFIAFLIHTIHIHSAMSKYTRW